MAGISHRVVSTIWDIRDPVLTTPDLLQELPYSPLLIKLLQLRGLKDPASVQRFLFPELEHLYDPFLMKGMRRAALRILAAAENGETILVHGDYDVDGITGAALLVLVILENSSLRKIFTSSRIRSKVMIVSLTE